MWNIGNQTTGELSGQSGQSGQSGLRSGAVIFGVKRSVIGIAMGNQSSAYDPTHLRMYQNLIQIQDPGKRSQVIQTCLASMEYVQSAKRAGLYSHLLHYLSVASSGQVPAPLPGERGASGSSPSLNAPSGGGAGMRMAATHPSMMSTTNRDGIAATHPSLVKAPTASAYAKQGQQGQQAYAIQTHTEAAQPSWKVVTDTSKQKAISYFSSCLEVLGIQEEVALTEEALKKAYKRAAIKAHPDKGGSEEFFEAVTRAYAYLSEILRYMKGGRGAGADQSTPSAQRNAQEVQSQRTQEADQWKHAEPVRLNAKNLDMNAFNQLFSETHMPDPDADGYGDWLKDDGGAGGGGGGGSQSQSIKFKGEFNRDVFNRMFEDEAKKSQRGGNQLVVHPGEMALTLNPSGGTELVAERPSSFTAAAGSRVQYTDLRGAYGSEATISDKVANVTVGERKLDEYRASRERAPDPLSDTELHGIRDFERRQQQQESLRERKKAEQAMRENDYFSRMKQRVITDGATDLNAGGRR